MTLLQKLFSSLAILALVASCAPVMQPPLAPLAADSATMAKGKYISKVNSFQILLDASLSMDEGGTNNFLVGRDVASRINQGIPTDLNYTAGLRSVGHNSQQSKNPTDLLYGMTNYQRGDLHNSLNKIKYTGGPTPMGVALAAAGNDLSSGSGKSALIIVSDGLFMDEAPEAAKQLKAKLGNDFCIYTIAVGNGNNGAGHDLLKKVADAGQCGSATSAAALADDAAMAAFVERVFLAKPVAAKPVAVKPVPKAVAPRDSDGDGVIDAKDKCPNTPRGEIVDADGCTLKLTLHINFDFDSAVIKPEFVVDMDRAAAYIQKNKKVPYILIAGHTDNKGAEEYNQQLSEKRANAVRQNLIDNYGVAADRLFIKGYGKLQPVADNNTKEGRYQNRRVEIICCAIKPE